MMNFVFTTRNYVLEELFILKNEFCRSATVAICIKHDELFY